MSENKLDKARELLKKNLYFLDKLKNNDEWNKLNISQEELIILVKEYIDNMLDEVNQRIIYSEDDIEKRKEVRGVR